MDQSREVCFLLLTDGPADEVPLRCVCSNRLGCLHLKSSPVQPMLLRDELLGRRVTPAFVTPTPPSLLKFLYALLDGVLDGGQMVINRCFEWAVEDVGVEMVGDVCEDGWFQLLISIH